MISQILWFHNTMNSMITIIALITWKLWLLDSKITHNNFDNNDKLKFECFGSMTMLLLIFNSQNIVTFWPLSEFIWWVFIIFEKNIFNNIKIEYDTLNIFIYKNKKRLIVL